MTSACLDRKEVQHATWRVQCEDRPAGGNTGRLFLAFGGPVCAERISNCPLDRVLTYKNLIYLLNLQIFATFGGHLWILAENEKCEYLGNGISSPLILGGRYTLRQWSCLYRTFTCRNNYLSSFSDVWRAGLRRPV